MDGKPPETGGLFSGDGLPGAGVENKQREDTGEKAVYSRHRSRMKNRFKKNGFEGFAPHEVMEFLLFFGIPYKDTNETARLLIERYGSFAEALNADPQDLMRVKGLGEHAAILLSMMPVLFRYYQLDQFKEHPLMDNAETIGEYGKALFTGYSNEAMYVLCLNAKNRLLYADLVARGTINEITVYARSVAETAIRYKAKSVVLMHNHPSGVLMPSRDDVSMTRAIADALLPLKIGVLDHLIIAKDKYFSFKEKGLLDF